MDSTYPSLVSARRRLAMALLVLVLSLICAPPPLPAKATAREAPPAADFLLLLEGDDSEAGKALARIARGWHPGNAVMLVETLPFLRNPDRTERILSLLERKTGQRHGFDLDAWYRWLWSREAEAHPRYAEFKSLLYRRIDPRFGGYFSTDRPSRIRLDEVRWGGVLQDGIPPLRSPKMISAQEADYLADQDIVFGLSVGGDARAYPKRILAWHEMFVDQVGGLPVVGVYCTLCGTVILYETTVEGVDHALGTSGFLYRSNKLMYDRATQSLWSTLKGEPVIGPLAKSGLQLARGSVVTSTWEEWRRRHPETSVLSLDTGHRRDYSEGAAYREYFATDELMFGIPRTDRRLANKAEVLALLFQEQPGEALAISQDFLRQHPVYEDRIGEIEFVVLTSPAGANRVYRTAGLSFRSWDGDRIAVAEDGSEYTVTEAALEPRTADGQAQRLSLPRLPSQRAFWFGWFGAFPHTRLVK